MARRLHVPHLIIGTIELPQAEAHHARNVLRLTEGSAIELFDDQGHVAHARLTFDGPNGATVTIDRIETPTVTVQQLTIIAAVPKGDRADWMIEKLSELGVSRFVPLAAARSVVLPEGKNKRDRWVRIATEAAKQSRRSGVMRIDELTSLKSAVNETKSHRAAYLSTEPDARTILALATENAGNNLTLFVGPEGGWTSDERDAFAEAGLTALRLTDTILRVETAAVAAAAVVRCLAN